MKVNYTSGDGRLTVEVEGETQKSIFGELAKFQEVFEHSTCGKCSSTDVRFVVRNVDDNDFYEIHCQNSKCRARLAFGQHKSKEGTLFPRRKDGEGSWLPNGGWVKFNTQTGKDE
ncbi:MAG: hypothetical protein MN733_28065 [Nitrososphaera sp.]|nr:hypothetical protein [Nitrososphaera sp.]